MEKQQQIQKSVIEQVTERIEKIRAVGGINLPKDYSIANAIQAAGLVLADIVDKNKKPALEVCTKASIANSLFYMITQGLNPLKNQCYFIVYGSKLQCQRSYEGAKALAKRFSKVQDVFAHAIFEGDNFEYMVNLETGMKELIKHEPKLENIDQSKIKGAYAIVIREDGIRDLEVMTIQDIKKAWLMRPGNGLTDAHKDFPDQMACKTVIKRACKKYIDSSNDSVLLPETSEEIEGSQDDINEPKTINILAEVPNSRELPPNANVKETKPKDASEPPKNGKKNSKEGKTEEIQQEPNF